MLSLRLARGGFMGGAADTPMMRQFLRIKAKTRRHPAVPHGRLLRGVLRRRSPSRGSSSLLRGTSDPEPIRWPGFRTTPSRRICLAWYRLGERSPSRNSGRQPRADQADGASHRARGDAQGPVGQRRTGCPRSLLPRRHPRARVPCTHRPRLSRHHDGSRLTTVEDLGTACDSWCAWGP